MKIRAQVLREIYPALLLILLLMTWSLRSSGVPDHPHHEEPGLVTLVEHPPDKLASDIFSAQRNSNGKSITLNHKPNRGEE